MLKISLQKKYPQKKLTTKILRDGKIPCKNILYKKLPAKKSKQLKNFQKKIILLKISCEKKYPQKKNKVENSTQKKNFMQKYSPQKNYSKKITNQKN